MFFADSPDYVTDFNFLGKRTFSPLGKLFRGFLSNKSALAGKRRRLIEGLRSRMFVSVDLKRLSSSEPSNAKALISRKPFASNG